MLWNLFICDFFKYIFFDKTHQIRAVDLHDILILFFMVDYPNHLIHFEMMTMEFFFSKVSKNFHMSANKKKNITIIIYSSIIRINKNKLNYYFKYEPSS